jgi:hypothetical protein
MLSMYYIKLNGLVRSVVKEAPWVATTECLSLPALDAVASTLSIPIKASS